MEKRRWRNRYCNVIKNTIESNKVNQESEFLIDLIILKELLKHLYQMLNQLFPIPVQHIDYRNFN